MRLGKLPYQRFSATRRQRRYGPILVRLEPVEGGWGLTFWGRKRNAIIGFGNR